MTDLHPVNEPGAPGVPLGGTGTLDRAFLHGIAWTAGAKWLSQILSWAATLLVARLLDPADFGIVGMAMVVLSFIALVSEFGVTSAVVTLRDLTDDDVRRLNAIAVTFGIVAFLVAAALAVPMGRYFHSDILPRVILVQSTVCIIASFQSVPNGWLSRQLRFKRLASVDVARSVVASVSALALALAGAHYWTLVGAELIAATVQSVLLIWSAPIGFRWSGFGRVRHAIVFGGRLLAGSLAWYVYSNADFFVAGRVLGTAALGAYSFAWQLTSLPVEKVTALVGRVTPALLAAASSDRAAVRRFVSRITEGIALLTFPATVGMAIVAPDVIPIVFGRKWELAIVPFQFLAGGMVLRSIVPVISNAMRAVHDVRFLMWHSIATALVLPPAFFAAAHLGGLRGIAFAWFVLYPIAVLPQYWRAIHVGIVDVRGYVTGVLPAVEGTAVMGLVVLGVRWALLQPAVPVSAPWRCALEIVAGAATYVAVIVLRHGARARTVLAFIRRREG